MYLCDITEDVLIMFLIPCCLNQTRYFWCLTQAKLWPFHNVNHVMTKVWFNYAVVCLLMVLCGIIYVLLGEFYIGKNNWLWPRTYLLKVLQSTLFFNVPFLSSQKLTRNVVTFYVWRANFCDLVHIQRKRKKSARIKFSPKTLKQTLTLPPHPFSYAPHKVFLLTAHGSSPAEAVTAELHGVLVNWQFLVSADMLHYAYLPQCPLQYFPF